MYPFIPGPRIQRPLRMFIPVEVIWSRKLLCNILCGVSVRAAPKSPYSTGTPTGGLARIRIRNFGEKRRSRKKTAPWAGLFYRDSLDVFVLGEFVVEDRSDFSEVSESYTCESPGWSSCRIR